MRSHSLMVMAATVANEYLDHASQLKAFEESKLGVKGIADLGVATIPPIFTHDPNHRPNSNNTSQTVDIPTIDLQGVHDDDSGVYNKIVQKVKDVAETWSIFRVVNHGIPQSLLDDVIAGAKGFHEQDDELKKALYSRDGKKRVSFSSNYNISSGRPLDWRDTFFCLVAPDLPTEELPEICRDAFTEYTYHVKKLSSRLFRLLSSSLGLTKTRLEDMGCAKRLCLLGNYYPPCPQPKLTLGASSHADSGFLTVLLQDQVEGLQLLRNGRWLNVRPMHGALIVNMGYLMQLVTNDKFKSVTHRVVAPQKTRVSVAALFRTHYDRGDDQQIFGPIKELVSDENHLHYKDVTVEEYVRCLYEKGPEMSSVLDYFRL